MGPRKRLNTPLHGRTKLLDIFCPGQRNDRVNHRERIFRTVIDLSGEQRLAVLRLLTVGDIDRNAPEARYAAVCILDCSGAAKTPPHAAIRTANAEFNLIAPSVLSGPFEQLAKHFPIATIDQLPDVGKHDLEGRAVHAKYLLLPVIPNTTAI